MQWISFRVYQVTKEYNIMTVNTVLIADNVMNNAVAGCLTLLPFLFTSILLYDFVILVYIVFFYETRDLSNHRFKVENINDLWHHINNINITLDKVNRNCFLNVFQIMLRLTSNLTECSWIPLFNLERPQPRYWETQRNPDKKNQKTSFQFSKGLPQGRT